MVPGTLVETLKNIKTIGGKVLIPKGTRALVEQELDSGVMFIADEKTGDGQYSGFVYDDEVKVIGFDDEEGC